MNDLDGNCCSRQLRFLLRKEKEGREGKGMEGGDSRAPRDPHDAQDARNSLCIFLFGCKRQTHGRRKGNRIRLQDSNLQLISKLFMTPLLYSMCDTNHTDPPPHTYRLASERRGKERREKVKDFTKAARRSDISVGGRSRTSDQPQEGRHRILLSCRHSCAEKKWLERRHKALVRSEN